MSIFSLTKLLLIQVGEILGTLIKTFKASFLPFFDELASYLTPMWVSSTTNCLFLCDKTFFKIGL